MALILVTFCTKISLSAQNQTASVDIPSMAANLPFAVSIEKTKMKIPNGLHSYAFGVYEGKMAFNSRQNEWHAYV